MNVLIINGPNLNILGRRNPEIYGAETFEETFERLQEKFPDDSLVYFQSNCEGDIIDFIQKYANGENVAGIVINPGAYAHYSYAIADALADAPVPAAEVHISNIHARESFRSQSVTAPSCKAVFCGCGRKGYEYAVDFILSLAKA